MKKTLATIIALVAVAAFGERSLKPGIDAFNASVPADSADTVAFSPLSFELDCCMFAEALDPIGRANVSEKLSVMTDFTGAYNPILDALEAAEPTNRVFFKSARTIGVTEINKVNPDFKRRVFDLRTNASMSLLWPTRGAECWFKAMLDGWLEDYTMPFGKAGIHEYSLVDAAIVVASFQSDAGCLEEKRDFRRADGSTEKIPFVKFRAKVDYVRNAEKTMLRIPLRGDAYLYLVSPGKGKTLADVRKAIVGESMQSYILEPLDSAAKGNGSALCEVSMPKLDVMFSTPTDKGFDALGIQQKDITYLYPELTSRSAFQTVRFVLDAGVVADGGDVLTAASEKAAFNHPFVYFVYIPDKNTMPVIGQFTGK